MNVEFTGRQFEITPAIRKQVQHGLAKLIKIIGDNFEAHIILTAEKYRHIAEITVVVRAKSIVGLAQASEMLLAVGEALDRIERQALKYKGRKRSVKRHARKKWEAAGGPLSARRNGNRAAAMQAAAVDVAVGANATTAVPVVVHTFPATVHITETHVVPAQDAVAMSPLTLEEAVKEAEFRDRDVFVFRDKDGRVRVLHRTRDGKMELIEAP